MGQQRHRDTGVHHLYFEVCICIGKIKMPILHHSPTYTSVILGWPVSIKQRGAYVFYYKQNKTQLA